MNPGSLDDVVRSRVHSGAAQSTRPERGTMATPFPWLPMVAIVMCLVTVTYTLCNPFPYAGYMVQHLGVADDKDEAGFYAGYLSSAFMFGRLVGSYFWGYVADRYGRLPVLYVGLCSIAIFSVAFGLSTVFVWAVAFRLLTGALSGIVATARTMITEVCGSEHEVVGMSFLAGSWSVGLILGSGLGGLLAEPAHHYPTMFSETGLFGRFPYLLPNVLGASLALVGLLLVFFFLEESLDIPKDGDRHDFKRISTPKAELHSQDTATTKERSTSTTCLDHGYDPQIANGGNHGGSDGSSVQERADERLPLVQQQLLVLESGELRSTHGGSGGKTPSEGEGIAEGEGFDACGGESLQGGGGMPFWTGCLRPLKLLKEERVGTPIFVYVLISLIYNGCDETYPLWAISSVGSGGLDWTPQDVGKVLSACGGAVIVFQFLLYPRIVARIGPTRSQRWTCCVAIPSFFAYPFLSRLHDSKCVLMAASLIVLFVTSMAGNVMFMNTSLAINNAVKPSQRSTINGLSMMLASLATAIGPTVFANIFAWSIDRPRPFPIDCHLVFCLLALCMVVVMITSWNTVITPVELSSKDSAASPVVMADAVDGGVEDKGLSSAT